QHFFSNSPHVYVCYNQHLNIASIWIKSTQCQRTVNIETNKILVYYFFALSYKLFNHFFNIRGTVFPIITHVETPFPCLGLISPFLSSSHQGGAPIIL